jgi:hypothetical protein
MNRIAASFSQVIKAGAIVLACSQFSAYASGTQPEGAICFYEHVDYQGASFCANADSNWIGSAWNDRASSAKVRSGAKINLFNDTNYGGKSITLTGDAPNFVSLNFNDVTSSFRVASAQPAPPERWQEHWFDHDQNLTRVFYDDDLAVYFDGDVDRSYTWMNRYIGDVWRYTKKTYGAFGSDSRLFAVFHTNKYSGGHPSTYFDASHDNRNVIDAGPGPWKNGTGNDLDLTTHEVGHIVEGASKGVHNSPAFGLWKDSKWMEIYIYDVYKGLGRTDDVKRWYNTVIGTRDDFPRANSYWFRDWFYPIYNEHGGTATLNNYFTLLAQCFPKNGTSYARDLNWGEFVHFWSGASGTNLQAQANKAFGWPADWDAQFKKAQKDFACANNYPH